MPHSSSHSSGNSWLCRIVRLHTALQAPHTRMTALPLPIHIPPPAHPRSLSSVRVCTYDLFDTPLRGSGGSHAPALPTKQARARAAGVHAYPAEQRAGFPAGVIWTPGWSADFVPEALRTTRNLPRNPSLWTPLRASPHPLRPLEKPGPLQSRGVFPALTLAWLCAVVFRQHRDATHPDGS